MLMTGRCFALVKSVVPEPSIAYRNMLPAYAGFEELSSWRAQMPDFEPALQSDQRAQPNSSKRMRAFLGDFGKMGGTINLAPLYPAPAGDWMAAKVAKIAAANSAQEVKIDYNPRGFS